MLFKEILGKIDSAVLASGRILKIQGGGGKHFAGALAVAAGENRRMGVNKAPLLEKLVDAKGRRGTHPERRGEGVCPRPQMGDGSQVLQAVALLLKRIFRRRRAFHQNFTGVKLKRLLRLRSFHKLAVNGHRRSYVQLGDFLKVINFLILKDHLDALKAAAVVQFHKA